MIVIYQSYYYEPDEGRAKELCRARNENLANPAVGAVVLLVEPGGPEPDAGFQIVRVGRRPTYSDFFRVANDFGCGSLRVVNVIANSDIAFDRSVALVDAMRREDAYAITRHEVEQGEVKRVQGPDSQDAWVFRGPIRHMNADFELGTPGCDNRLVWEMKHAGYQVSNPCLSVVARHYHESAIRRYPDRSVPGPYDWAHPCELVSPILTGAVRQRRIR